jgi:LCP family protein required for cell wall assembly
MLKNKKILFVILSILAFFAIIFYVVKPVRQGMTVLTGVIFDKSIGVKNEDGIVRIALLGRGGGAHEGPDLTDTIMIVSLNTKTNQVSLFSFPRDFWYQEKQEKINTVYSHARIENEKTSLQQITKVLSSITGHEIQYTFLIEFEGFVQAIDALGGITVNVENSFTDPEYPVEGKEQDTCGKSEDELQALSTASSQLEAFPCRYKSISFQKGEVKMSGNTALEFVRSRHALGKEGTDFARSKRQQQVLSAMKEKVLTLGVLANPPKLFNIYDIIASHIKTNITEGEFDDFIKLAQKMKDSGINTYVLDYGDEVKGQYGLLENPPISDEYNYQWVLVPRKGNGDYTEIKSYIECVEKEMICTINEKGIDMKPKTNEEK